MMYPAPMPVHAAPISSYGGPSGSYGDYSINRYYLFKVVETGMGPIIFHSLIVLKSCCR